MFASEISSGLNLSLDDGRKGLIRIWYLAFHDFKLFRSSFLNGRFFGEWDSR